eukprot:scaffold26025_cov101-Isochrysis_galbana.AAC.1
MAMLRHGAHGHGRLPPRGVRADSDGLTLRTWARMPPASSCAASSWHWAVRRVLSWPLRKMGISTA